MSAFGPVPSRRLGYSLGVNHIPPKHCPYSCVYCQVGRTNRLEITQREFFPVEEILQAVEGKINESAKVNQSIDYLTLVPDGEPTLDLNLTNIIQGLKKFRIPIAVISNAALIDRQGVQDSLLQADWVSLKVDTVIETEWRRINRPHRQLSLESILNGILGFRSRYQGELVTETMLIADINDNPISTQTLVSYLLELQPFKSYLSIPIRPPAEAWVKVPDAHALKKIFQTFSKDIAFADLLFDAEESEFVSTGNVVDDILGITAVHPIREEALRRMLKRADVKWLAVEELVRLNKVICLEYRGERFYLQSSSSNRSIE